MDSNEELPKRIFHSAEWERLVADENTAQAKVNQPVDRRPLTTAEINEIARKFNEKRTR